jgi:hypothetical protein
MQILYAMCPVVYRLILVYMTGRDKRGPLRKKCIAEIIESTCTIAQVHVVIYHVLKCA